MIDRKVIKSKRKFVLIAKVDHYTFVKYRFNKLDNVLKFMLEKYPKLRFINFYYNQGMNKGSKFAEYGSKKGLIYYS